MNKLVTKSKNPIKVKKKQLCDRINKCKSLKELKEFEKVLSYYPVLKDNEDWDYDFLLDLIEFKLSRMSNYFHTHHIVINEDWYGTLCDRAIAILRAGYKTDIILSKDLNDIYVNIKNAKRFIPKYYYKNLESNDEYWNKYGLATIREYKAKALFWKFLHHYIEYLWD